MSIITEKNNSNAYYELIGSALSVLFSSDKACLDKITSLKKRILDPAYNNSLKIFYDPLGDAIGYISWDVLIEKKSSFEYKTIHIIDFYCLDSIIGILLSHLKLTLFTNVHFISWRSRRTNKIFIKRFNSYNVNISKI